MFKLKNRYIKDRMDGQLKYYIPYPLAFGGGGGGGEVVKKNRVFSQFYGPNDK